MQLKTISFRKILFWVDYNNNDWKNSELRNMDRKTRKVLNMYHTAPKIKCR